MLAGSAPESAKAHCRVCMDLFSSVCSTAAVQRVLVAALPNGNWKNLEQVEFYVGASTTLSRKAIEHLHLSGLTYALCGHRPHIFPRHGWTGADKATSDLSKLERIHGLLTHTYTAFVDLLSSPGITPGKAAADEASVFPDPETMMPSTEGELNRNPPQGEEWKDRSSRA